MAVALKPRPAITRSRYHEYSFEGVTYPGVTGILKVYDKSDPLMAWAARNTAEVAIAQVDNLASLLATSGQEGVVRLLTARSTWKRDEAAQIGSRVHSIADLIVQGQPVDELLLDEVVATRVDHYLRWWQASGWKIRLSEAYVIHRGLAFGGTFDLLAYDDQGRTVLADIKTGKGIYPETALQLAAYGMAEFVAPVTSATVYPMPAVERYVVLHVTETGVREIEMEVGDAERIAFRACLALSSWKKSRKEGSL